MMAAGVKVSKIGTFEFNPRGNLWFNDDSTFGHKLLSKMGWSKGKRLGKNEDGIKENVKISKKDSLSGVGWKNNVPIAAGCLEYEKILNNLQQHFKSKESKTEKNNDLPDLKSLEQRSKNSRNRLHYQKFVRGKDLIRYSEKDMKCIFLEKNEDSDTEPRDKKHDLPSFTSQMTVQDYFAMKMQKKSGKILEKDTQSECENVPSEETPSSNQESNRKRKNKFPDWNKIKRTKIECEELLDELSNHTSPNHTANYTSPVENDSQETNAFEETLTSDHRKLSKKAKKSKKNKLKSLKSCVKNGSSYNLEKERKVTFNEQVSYKILDTSLELCAEINDSNAGEESVVDQELANDLLSNEVMCSNSEEDDDSGREVSLEEEGDKEMEACEEEPLCVSAEGQAEGGDNEIEEDNEEMEKPLPKCFDLPKNSNSNYSFWLENQRQALKMKLYKGMIKKIKKHKILGTSNLLDIKGYGNWGF